MKSKSLRFRILLLLVGTTAIAALICGIIGYYNSRAVADSDAKEKLTTVSEGYGKDIDNLLSQVEVAVNTLADVTKNQIQDVDKFKSSSSYVDSCTEALETTALQCAKNTKGAMTYYIRYNPEFTEATSGIFASKESENADFKSLTPTDFSSFDKDDAEHVGWYYIPVKNGKATWMDPYLNSNVNVYMISYVVPIMIDNEAIGVVGMDINFNQLKQLADKAKCFDSGYVFLVDSSNKVLSHKDIKQGTDLQKVDGELASFVKAGKTGEIKEYTYNGKIIKEGIYSPITQNQRHLELYKMLREKDKGSVMKFLYNETFSSGFKSLVVLANPKSILKSRYAPKEIKEKVIKADQLIDYIKKHEQSAFRNQKDMIAMADGLLSYHQKQEIPPIQEENTFESIAINNDDHLIESLKKYRMNKAQEKNLPPYYIFNDITLNEIVAYKPTTIEELLSIKGFGPKKCDWYGEDILDIIRSL